SAVEVSADEGFDGFVGSFVVVLLRRRLHEVGGGGDEGPADAAVEADLGCADGVDDDAGGVRGVPDLELVLQGHGSVAGVAALEADEGPFAVVEACDVVAGSDVDIAIGQLGARIRGHGLGLRNLLRLEALAFEHVLEVHVAADVELVGAVEDDAAVLEQLRHHTVGDGRTDLGLDVVADDRDSGGTELLVPFLGPGDEDGQSVDEGDLRVDGRLSVVLHRFLRTDGHVAYEHVRLGVLERLDHVDRVTIGFDDRVAVVLSEAVESRSAQDLDAGRLDIAEFDGVVLTGRDRLGDVDADLLAVDIEGGNEIDVTDVIIPELHVHETRNFRPRGHIPVVLNTLDQGRGAVAQSGNRDSNRFRSHS